MSHKSHKASLVRAGAFAAAATLAGIGPASTHTVIGQRIFPPRSPSTILASTTN